MVELVWVYNILTQFANESHNKQFPQVYKQLYGEELQVSDEIHCTEKNLIWVTDTTWGHLL